MLLLDRLPGLGQGTAQLLGSLLSCWKPLPRGARAHPMEGWAPSHRRGWLQQHLLLHYDYYSTFFFQLIIWRNGVKHSRENLLALRDPNPSVTPL